jgi:DNA-binding winged helix-turn-helix (wHTH) protein
VTARRHSSATTIRFGPAGAPAGDRGQYILDLDTLELRHRGHPVRLRPRAVGLLALLLRAEGRLVPAEELRSGLWGETHLEWRNGLHRCVRDLRLALGDDARQPRLVATVARLGYRFVGEIVPSSELEHPKPVAAERVAAGTRRRSTAFMAGFGAALLVPLAILFICSAAAR